MALYEEYKYMYQMKIGIPKINWNRIDVCLSYISNLYLLNIYVMADIKNAKNAIPKKKRTLKSKGHGTSMSHVLIIQSFKVCFTSFLPNIFSEFLGCDFLGVLGIFLRIAWSIIHFLLGNI